MCGRKRCSPMLHRPCCSKEPALRQLGGTAPSLPTLTSLRPRYLVVSLHSSGYTALASCRRYRSSAGAKRSTSQISLEYWSEVWQRSALLDPTQTPHADVQTL